MRRSRRRKALSEKDKRGLIILAGTGVLAIVLVVAPPYCAGPAGV